MPAPCPDVGCEVNAMGVPDPSTKVRLPTGDMFGVTLRPGSMGVAPAGVQSKTLAHTYAAAQVTLFRCMRTPSEVWEYGTAPDARNG